MLPEVLALSQVWDFGLGVEVLNPGRKRAKLPLAVAGFDSLEVGETSRTCFKVQSWKQRNSLFQS